MTSQKFDRILHRIYSPGKIIIMTKRICKVRVDDNYKKSLNVFVPDIVKYFTMASRQILTSTQRTSFIFYTITIEQWDGNKVSNVQFDNIVI